MEWNNPLGNHLNQFVPQIYQGHHISGSLLHGHQSRIHCLHATSGGGIKAKTHFQSRALPPHQKSGEKMRLVQWHTDMTAEK